MKITGKEIVQKWANECLRKRLTVDLTDTAYAGILAHEWANLIERIDEALRDSKQNGLDYRKQTKLIADESEYGPFWSAFYRRGGLELEGLAEAFDCSKEESIWQNQWNEVIRIALKKPLLRAVAPDDFIFYLRSEIGQTDLLRRIEQLIDSVINSLAIEKVDEARPQWSPGKGFHS